MDDRAALLNQLRIDRRDEDLPPERPWRKWLIGAVVVVLLIALAGWWLRPPPGVPVTVATARPATEADLAAAGAAGGGGAALLDAAGYVVARRAATVSAKLTGLVTEVLIEEGQQVAAGEVVARLDDTNIRASLAQAQAQAQAAAAQVAQVRVALANAERELTRQRGLVAQKFVSAAALDAAQTAVEVQAAALVTAQRNRAVAEAAVQVAQRSFDDTTVRAPFAGVITVKAAQVGEIVSPLSAGGGFTRTGIGTVVDMASLEVEVDVNENFINRVQPGQPAVIRLNAYPDWAIPARTIAVIPTADRSKATVKVRVGFDTRDARVLPEMGARVSFLEAAAAKAPAAAGAAAPAAGGVVIPAAAVQPSGAAGSDTGAVFLIRRETVERRAVRLGAKRGSEQVVIAGLNPGDRVALGDLTALADGVRIRIETANDGDGQ